MTREDDRFQRGTAVVFTGDLFHTHRAKTAHGLIRHGRRYDVLAVVDTEAVGEDAGSHVGVDASIPIISDIDEAPEADHLIIGVAYPGGKLRAGFRETVVRAIQRGMNIISGLHDFLGDDDELRTLAERNDVGIWDVRRPPESLNVARHDERFLDAGSSCPVLLAVATDANIGKRTASLCIVRLAEERGVDVAFLATGQSGIMIGCDEGVVADSIPGDFISGEIEKRVVSLLKRGKELIVVEGNGSLGHHAYGPVALGILRGSHATHLLMCHDPGKGERSSFPGIPVPSIEDELPIVRAHSGAELIGISLRNRGDPDWQSWTERYSKKYGVPVLDPIREGVAPFLDRILPRSQEPF